ncbi:MAG: SH3-like domain-containing protein [Pseudomonadota bacterium]
MQTLDPGTRVRVRQMMPLGHVRTPAYLRGQIGRVERVLGPFANPEQLAYGQPAMSLPLYRVRFDLADIWPDSTAAGDTIDAEIYAHWLEHA